MFLRVTHDAAEPQPWTTRYTEYLSADDAPPTRKPSPGRAALAAVAAARRAAQRPDRRQDAVQRLCPRHLRAARDPGGARHRHADRHRNADQRVLRIDRARRDAAQLPGDLCRRRQRRADRCRAQRDLVQHGDLVCRCDDDRAGAGRARRRQAPARRRPVRSRAPWRRRRSRRGRAATARPGRGPALP